MKLCSACGQEKSEDEFYMGYNQEMLGISIRDHLEMSNPEAKLWDDCDAALIGVAERCGQPPLAVYSWDKLVKVFEDQGMEFEEAVEWVGFNLEGAWVGDHTPLIMHEYDGGV